MAMQERQHLTLQQLVKEERERLGLSLRDVADRSGGLLSASTVHAIESGQRTSVSDDVLTGLARGLGLPASRVERAAMLASSDTTEPFELPRRAQRLTRKERQHILDLIDLLLERRSR